MDCKFKLEQKKNILTTCKCERNYTLVDLHNSLRSYSSYYSVIANYSLVAEQYVLYSCLLSFANERSCDSRSFKLSL